MAWKCIDLYNLSALVLLKLTDSWPQHPCSDKRADSTDHMDAVGTRVIMEAPLCQETTAPGPVRLNRVDHRGNDGRIDTIARKLRSLRHRTRYNRRSCRAEHEVENKCGIIERTILRKYIKAETAGKAFQDVRPEHQGCSADKPHHGSDTEIHQVLHDDVSGVLRPGEACLAHGKACLHPEYKGGPCQKPHCEDFTVQCLHHFH